MGIWNDGCLGFDVRDFQRFKIGDEDWELIIWDWGVGFTDVSWNLEIGNCDLDSGNYGNDNEDDREEDENDDWDLG